MKLTDILNNTTIKRKPPIILNLLNKFKNACFDFNNKLDEILKKYPFSCTILTGLLCKFAFFETEISTCLVFSFFIYYKVLYIFFLEKKIKKGLLLGIVYGFSIFCQLFSWFLNMHEYGIGENWFETFISIVGFSMSSLYLTIYMMLSTYFSLKFAYDKMSLYLYFTFFYTFFEIVQRFFLELSPFIILSYGLSGYEYFIQVGSIIGSYGLTFVFLLIMSFLMFKRYFKYGLYIFFLCSIYGFYKIHLKNNYKIPKENFDITVVQTNFSEKGRHSYYSSCCDDFAKMSNVENIKNYNRKRLIIAPETLIGSGTYQINYLIKKTLNIDDIKNKLIELKNIEDDNKKEELKKIIENKSNNIIVCTGFYATENKKKYNSYQFFNYDYTKDNFRVLAKYYKKYLVPLGENCPYLVLKILELLAKCTNKFKSVYDDYIYYKLSEGDGKNTIDIEGISPFAMNLCSDIIPPGVTLYDSYKPTWILSTMNFHVFNDDKKTTFLARLCYLCGKYRAIEFNRPNVMCINFGYSCILDCNGRPIVVLDPKKRDIIEYNMQLKYDISLYSVWRNKLLYTLMLLLFLFLIINKKRKYILFYE